MENNLAIHNTEINLSFNPYLEIYPTEVKASLLKDTGIKMSPVCDGGEKVRNNLNAHWEKPTEMGYYEARKKE